MFINLIIRHNYVIIFVADHDLIMLQYEVTELFMERYCLLKIVEWKNGRKRKPLVLMGARQVGKTWLMEEFAKREYPHDHVIVNFMRKRSLCEQLRTGDIDPATLIRLLQTATGKRTIPGQTLLILDEIQGQREQEVFADVRDIEKALSKAFSRILWLYPETEIPTLYLFVSGFQTPIYFGEELIAIGADMYLGSDYEYYNRVAYNYQKQTMRKECIPVDVVSAYLFRTLPYTSSKSRLLDQMMYRGKVMYLTAQLFDELPGYEVMGWTKEQWDWCVKNEKAIWHLVMDKRDLFKTESIILTSYLNDGPFTAEVSQEAPGRLGIWLGWRIAESYMEHNEQVSLQDLMAEGDAQKILEDSYYKP